MPDSLTLIPYPASLTRHDGIYPLPRTGAIVLADSSLLFEAGWIQSALKAHDLIYSIGLYPTSSGVIDLRRDEGLSAQAYTLTIQADGVTVVGGDAAGVFYGLCTLRQIMRNTGDHLPLLTVEDHPDFAYRGYMLDISRDRVPTRQTLFQLVDELAALKINQLQLYTEHTFAYPGHDIVWEQASPLTSEDVLLLDAYCRQRHIELVPNQNSLGHMERWLQHPAYRPLAESADGFIGPDGRRRGPTTLAPLDPASLDLITSLYDVLLPHFNSQQFNAGCDEPWELGQGRSRDTVAERGGRVYFDWLMKLHAYLSKRGRRMMFWGDIIIKYPDLVPELPDDILVMEWGYEATHPFERHCQHYADAGIAFYVCPGTSSWNSLVGRADNAVGNIQAAARHGLAHGAEGLLLTDWGDYGHWQPPVASYIGIVYAAGVSWGYERNQVLNLAAALNTLIYRDRAGVMGQATLDISNLYQQIGPEHINGQVLAYVLQMAPDQIDAGLARVAEWGGGQPDVRPETLRSAIARIDAFIAALDSARPDRPDADLIRREWAQAAALLRHGATYLLWHQGVGADSAADLLRELDGLIARQRHNWLARSRRGGLEDSIRRFQPLRQAYTDRI